MTINTEKRPTAQEAIKHPWFDGKMEEENNSELAGEALKNFKTFRAEAKLQQATLSYIITQMSTKDDL